MIGIVMSLAGVGIVCASGVVVSSALKWFHSYEITIPKKEEKPKNFAGGVENAKRMEGLAARARQTK